MPPIGQNQAVELPTTMVSRPARPPVAVLVAGTMTPDQAAFTSPPEPRVRPDPSLFGQVVEFWTKSAVAQAIAAFGAFGGLVVASVFFPQAGVLAALGTAVGGSLLLGGILTYLVAK